MTDQSSSVCETQDVMNIGTHCANFIIIILRNQLGVPFPLSLTRGHGIPHHNPIGVELPFEMRGEFFLELEDKPSSPIRKGGSIGDQEDGDVVSALASPLSDRFFWSLGPLSSSSDSCILWISGGG